MMSAMSSSHINKQYKANSFNNFFFEHSTSLFWALSLYSGCLQEGLPECTQQSRYKKLLKEVFKISGPPPASLQGPPPHPGE